MTTINIETIKMHHIKDALSTMLNKKNDDELIKIKADKIFKYLNIPENLKRFNAFYKKYGQKMRGGKKKKTRKKKSLKKNSKKRRRIKKRSRKGGNTHVEYGVAFFIIVFAFYWMDFIPENTSNTNQTNDDEDDDDDEDDYDDDDGDGETKNPGNPSNGNNSNNNNGEEKQPPQN